jgi:hypothetical protein
MFAKKKTRKIVLNRETLRTLSHLELALARGAKDNEPVGENCPVMTDSCKLSGIQPPVPDDDKQC